jgi:hypothetical protein
LHPPSVCEALILRAHATFLPTHDDRASFLAAILPPAHVSPALHARSGSGSAAAGLSLPAAGAKPAKPEAGRRQPPRQPPPPPPPPRAAHAEGAASGDGGGSGGDGGVGVAMGAAAGGVGDGAEGGEAAATSLLDAAKAFFLDTALRCVGWRHRAGVSATMMTTPCAPLLLVGLFQGSRELGWSGVCFVGVFGGLAEASESTQGDGGGGGVAPGGWKEVGRRVAVLGEMSERVLQRLSFVFFELPTDAQVAMFFEQLAMKEFYMRSSHMLGAGAAGVSISLVDLCRSKAMGHYETDAARSSAYSECVITGPQCRVCRSRCCCCFCHERQHACRMSRRLAWSHLACCHLCPPCLAEAAQANSPIEPLCMQVSRHGHSIVATLCVCGCRFWLPVERLAGSAGGDLAKLEAFLGWFLREACGREGPTVAKELYHLRVIIIMIGTLD